MLHIFILKIRLTPLAIKASILFIFLVTVASCKKAQKEPETPEKLYTIYCASCHIAPDIDDLPKHIWENNVLPEMGARLGIRDNGFNPYKDLNLQEYEARLKSGIFPPRENPLITQENWDKLKEYIISTAPDSLVLDHNTLSEIKDLHQFKTKPVRLNPHRKSALMTVYLEHFKENNEIVMGTVQGHLLSHSFDTDESKPLYKSESGITSYFNIKGKKYITEVGQLNPSELSVGRLGIIQNDSLLVLEEKLHRPVHTLVEDLNNDGNIEFVVSEFGHLTGQLSLLKHSDKDNTLTKEALIGLPGVMRVISEDMDNDGKKDLVALAAQGDESVYIFYQKVNLEFKMDKVIRLSPVYGSSWFELVDYNGDGYKDIIIANGDNADYSVVNKPYHGIRIFINDGNNQFEQEYFHPINGATRLIAEDFDKDGDVDLAVIAHFPDYEKYPEQAFVYLENSDSKNFKFTSRTFSGATSGRWMLMESGDIDRDGDSDILLTPFPMVFPDTPHETVQQWIDKGVDLMILENVLYANDPVTK